MNDIYTETVEYEVDYKTVPGYLARPVAGPGPGIVVIQEWWGLVPHIKDVAGRFARQGYYALAPDLYHGEVAEEPDEARKLVMELDHDRAVREINGAVLYLRSLPLTGPKNVGVVGWCMGGGLAIQAAGLVEGVNAVVVFYGKPPDARFVKEIHVPLLGLYAEHDHGIPLERVHQFEKELKENDVPSEFHIYEGTQHAFFNETRPGIYNPEAAKGAWQRTLDWFGKYLWEGE